MTARCYYCEKNIDDGGALVIESTYHYCSLTCVRSDGFIDGYDEAIDVMDRRLAAQRERAEKAAESLVEQAYGELGAIVEEVRAEHVETNRPKAATPGVANGKIFNNTGRPLNVQLEWQGSMIGPPELKITIDEKAAP